MRGSQWLGRTTLVIGLLALLLTATGCGSSDGASAKSVARVEAENAKLKRADARLADRVASLEVAARRMAAVIATLRANDRALETGVYAAQHDVVCRNDPTYRCRVPLGQPGALSESADKPGRIFATPLP